MLNLASMEWTQLAKVLPETELFNPKLFKLPDGKYRGTPPIPASAKPFQNLRKQERYTVSSEMKAEVRLRSWN
jgi:hypothetical protein